MRNLTEYYIFTANQIATLPNPTDHSDFNLDTVLETYTALKYVIGQCADLMQKMHDIEVATGGYLEFVGNPSSYQGDDMKWHSEALNRLDNLMKVYNEKRTT